MLEATADATPGRATTYGLHFLELLYGVLRVESIGSEDGRIAWTMAAAAPPAGRLEAAWSRGRASSLGRGASMAMA